MDLSFCNQLLRVPSDSHRFWAHDPLPDPSHDSDVDPQSVTIPLAFTIHALDEPIQMDSDQAVLAVSSVQSSLLGCVGHPPMLGIHDTLVCNILNVVTTSTLWFTHWTTTTGDAYVAWISIPHRFIGA